MHGLLAQDVYRCLVGPRAFRGLLRIRTSREIRISKAYSPVAPVPEAQDLWQLPACGQHAAVGFDFEYINSAGFARPAGYSPPGVLQAAFQYSTFRPALKPAANGAGAPKGPQRNDGWELCSSCSHVNAPCDSTCVIIHSLCVHAVAAAAAAMAAAATMHMSKLMVPSPPLDMIHACRLLPERRMRILTISMPVALEPGDVYTHADADALLAMLVHKIGRVVMQQGVQQGQGLLQDWLVLFVAAYNAHRGLQPASPEEVRLKTFPCP